MDAEALTPMDERTVERPLRLARFDACIVSVPLKQPMKMAGVTITSADNLLVRLEAADGTVGWGEAASAPSMTGDTPEGMLAAARILRDAVQAADLVDPSLEARIGQALYGNSGAKAAFDLARLDLIARTRGSSVAELLGGARRTAITPMWLIGHATVEADIADAKARHREGYRMFKLKVGSKTIEEDIAAVHAVREAIGPDARLCADANGGLTFAAARRFVVEAESADLRFLEQPLPPAALAETAELQALGRVPIGADESIHGLGDIEDCAGQGAIAGLSLKVIKLGGARALLRAAERADALGLSLNIAGKVAETSLASAATAQLSSVVPNIDWGISLSHVYLAEDLVRDPITLVDGVVSPPPGPGWGVTVDESAVARFKQAAL